MSSQKLAATKTPAADSMRRRKLGAFFILTVLLYGKNSAVKWSGKQFRIKTKDFAQDLTMTSTKVRQHMDWLSKLRYVSDLEIETGSITGVLKRPLEREEDPEWT